MQNFKLLAAHISIHAPSRERQARSSSAPAPTVFQSTLPRGSDPYIFSPCFTLSLISIHAPSRERRQVLFQRHPVTRFQSTLPRGSDSYLTANQRAAFEFQSTLPRGSDDNLDVIFSGKPPFQSTLPRGSDFNQSRHKATARNISIHAPSRERLESPA